MQWSSSVVDRRVLAVGRLGQVADDLHHGVGALVLVAVDVGLDVDRHLDLVAPRPEQHLGERGIGAPSSAGSCQRW